MDAGATVTAKTAMDVTALHAAVSSGNLNLVQRLIKSGADVNATDAYNSSCLVWAAECNDPKIVAALLEAGAKPEVASNVVGTPLHVAAFQDRVEVGEMLMGRRFDANVPFGQLRLTPLHVAARNGSTKLIASLAAHGAQVDKPDVNAQTGADSCRRDESVRCRQGIAVGRGQSSGSRPQGGHSTRRRYRQRGPGNRSVAPEPIRSGDHDIDTVG